MSIDSRAMFNALTSLAAKTGQFQSVTGHEPKSAPAPSDVSCSIWANDLRPVQSSGLSSISIRLEFACRIYTSMLQEPQDGIDPRILDATDALFSAIIGNFDLDLSDTRYVDVLGSDGEGLRALPGYLTQDGKVFRVMEIFVPIIINDAYPEVA